MSEESIMPKRIKNPLLPIDATPEEYEIVQYSLTNIYSQFDDPIDKFIIAFCFELNYTQSLAADCLGVPTSQVPKRVSRIKQALLSSHKANINKE